MTYNIFDRLLFKKKTISEKLLYKIKLTQLTALTGKSPVSHKYASHIFYFIQK